MSRVHSSSLAVCVGLAFFLAGCGEEKQPALLCYVGGTMRPALEQLAKAYQAKTGQRIDLDYADSGQLLIKIEQTKQGDLYVCHDPFAGSLEKKGLARQIWTVASLTPTIAVPKGNSKGLHGLADLARKGIRIGLTDETYSTLGHICPVMFKKAGLTKEIEANVATRSRMGGEVANAVAIGQIDAAIVWNAVIFARREKLDAVPIEPAYLPQPGVDAVTSATYGPIDMGTVKVTLATLVCSKQPAAAAAFADFVASPAGKAAFDSLGFSPVPQAREGAEAKAPEPAKGTLYLYCGAGIRLPVAEAVEAFHAQTGIAVECDFAGSGILISRIKASRRGDLYMPGDAKYVDLAAKDGLIASRRDVCFFIPVILVRKGNPKGIRSLADLAKPGTELGLGDPRACAIGEVCEKLFEKNAVPLDAVKKNTAFLSLTVNELGIQIKTGKLDAAIVWDAIAAQYADSGEILAIPPEQTIITTVPIAVLKVSTQPELAGRFADFLVSDAGQAFFRKHHFTTTAPGR